MEYNIGKANDQHVVGKAGPRKKELLRKSEQLSVNCGGCKCDVWLWEVATASVAI